MKNPCQGYSQTKYGKKVTVVLFFIQLIKLIAPENQSKPYSICFPSFYTCKKLWYIIVKKSLHPFKPLACYIKKASDIKSAAWLTLTEVILIMLAISLEWLYWCIPIKVIFNQSLNMSTVEEEEWIFEHPNQTSLTQANDWTILVKSIQSYNLH